MNKKNLSLWKINMLDITEIRQELEELERERKELKKANKELERQNPEHNFSRLRRSYTNTKEKNDNRIIKTWKENDEKISNLSNKIEHLENQIKKIQNADTRKTQLAIINALRKENRFTMESKRFGKLYFSYKAEYWTSNEGKLFATGYTEKNRRFFEGLEKFSLEQPIEMKLIDTAYNRYLEPYYQLLAYVDPLGQKHLIPLPVFLESLQNEKYKQATKNKDNMDYDKKLEQAFAQTQQDFNLKIDYISKEERYPEENNENIEGNESIESDEGIE